MLMLTASTRIREISFETTLVRVGSLASRGRNPVIDGHKDGPKFFKTDVRMLRAIDSDSTEMFEYSVDQRSSDGAGKVSSRVCEMKFLKIFAKSGIFELERESRYQGSSS
jgi:hypothetical protein